MAGRPLLLALLLLAAASPAGAQQAAVCDLVAAVNPPRQEHAPGEGRAYQFTATNEGTLAGDVEVVLEGVTEGWTATVTPTAFDALQPGASGNAEVLVAAPAAGGAGQAQVTLTATLRCATPAGQLPVPGAPQEDRDSQVLTPTLAAATGGAAPARPGLDGSALLLLAGLAVVALGGAGAAYALRPRRLVVRAEAPRRAMPPGGGASFPVLLENRGAQDVQATVRVLGLPAGWKVLAPPAEVALRPGAAQTLQVLVRSPPDARPGDSADVQVELLERGSGRLHRVDLRADVEGPGGERPDVVVRDEATLGER